MKLTKENIRTMIYLAVRNSLDKIDRECASSNALPLSDEQRQVIGQEIQHMVQTAMAMSLEQFARKTTKREVEMLCHVWED